MKWKLFSYGKNFNNIIYILFLSSVQIKRFHHFRLFLFLCKTFHLGECHIICLERSRQTRSAKHQNGWGVCSATLSWSGQLGDWLNSFAFRPVAAKTKKAMKYPVCVFFLNLYLSIENNGFFYLQKRLHSWVIDRRPESGGFGGGYIFV